MAEAEAGCTDCHLDDENQVFRSGRAKCLDCHEQGYEEIFDEWQASFREKIGALRAAIQGIKRAGLSPDERKQLARVTRIVYALRTDGSSGVHNAMFFDEILASLAEQVESFSRTP
jgi:hypothetical protein